MATRRDNRAFIKRLLTLNEKQDWSCALLKAHPEWSKSEKRQTGWAQNWCITSELRLKPATLTFSSWRRLSSAESEQRFCLATAAPLSSVVVMEAPQVDSGQKPSSFTARWRLLIFGWSSNGVSDRGSTFPRKISSHILCKLNVYNHAVEKTRLWSRNVSDSAVIPGLQSKRNPGH